MQTLLRCYDVSVAFMKFVLTQKCSLAPQYLSSGESSQLLWCEVCHLLCVQNSLPLFVLKALHFFAVEQCMSDKPVPSPNVGNWTVENENKTACARYMFAAEFNITYTTILGKVWFMSKWYFQD